MVWRFPGEISGIWLRIWYLMVFFLSCLVYQNIACFVEGINDMGVSKNRGTPKWMVYNGKPY